MIEWYFPRYIPTLVGRLSALSFPPSQRTVHPHACGEIGDADAKMLHQYGTSPRLWGDSTISSLSCQKIRYIPTLVGRFGIGTTTRALFTVHPHACGEISPTTTRPPTATGTSPRLWGDLKFAVNHKVHARYIPTLVGRFSNV